jgi:hypothetical protein
MLEKKGGFIADIEILDIDKRVTDGYIFFDEVVEEDLVVRTIEDGDTFFDLGDIPLVVGVDLFLVVFLVEQKQEIMDVGFEDLFGFVEIDVLLDLGKRVLVD